MTLLRDTLHEYADRAPSGAGLLEAVRDRSRRRHRRRYAAVAGVAAVFTAAAAVAGPAAWHAVSAPAGGAPSAASQVDLVPPTYAMPSFPYSPGWAPAGLGAPRTGFSPDGYWLSYPRTGPGQPPLMLSVETKEPTWVSGKLPSAHAEAATVRGVAAIYTSGPDGVEVLSWQEQGQWLTVVAVPAIARADLFRFAEHLRFQPYPIRAPFTFRVLPDGARPVLAQGNLMQFSFGTGGNLVVQLVRATELPDGTLRVAVPGNSPAGHSAFASVGNSLYVGVSGTPEQADLRAIADGVALTDAASVDN